MPFFSSNTFRFLLLLLSLALTLTACGDADPETMPDDDVATVDADDTVPAEAPRAKMNLNTATDAAFLTIPGVDDRMVHEFEEYRPYLSIGQFRDEIGKYVDADQVAAYEQYVFVPINPNESDAETIAQIPGLDAALAATLIEGRPYASKAAFLEAVSAHITPEQQVQAYAYVTEP